MKAIRAFVTRKNANDNRLRAALVTFNRAIDQIGGEFTQSRLRTYSQLQNLVVLNRTANVKMNDGLAHLLYTRYTVYSQLVQPPPTDAVEHAVKEEFLAYAHQELALCCCMPVEEVTGRDSYGVILTRLLGMKRASHHMKQEKVIAWRLATTTTTSLPGEDDQGGSRFNTLNREIFLQTRGVLSREVTALTRAGDRVSVYWTSEDVIVPISVGVVFLIAVLIVSGAP